MMAFAVTSFASCTGDGYGSDGADGQPENPENPNPSDTLSGESNILVAYFSGKAKNSATTGLFIYSKGSLASIYGDGKANPSLTQAIRRP